VPKDRTGWASRSSGTQAQISSLPISKPAACGLTDGRTSVGGDFGRRVRIGEPPLFRGIHRIQTRSGHCKRTCSAGSALSPSAATSHHNTPDQNQSRQRAEPHTSVCTVLACLHAPQEYTPWRSPVSARRQTAQRSGTLVIIFFPPVGNSG
jgi:hypothetical protein